MKLQKILGSGVPFLWLDRLAYAEAALTDGSAPWLDVGEHVAWQRKAADLLRGDVVSLPLGKVAQAWLRNNPTLRAAMQKKTQVEFPLRALLADGGLQAQCARLLDGLKNGVSAPLHAVICPSPRVWLLEAYRQAFDARPPAAPDEDAVDVAAMTIASLLRGFSESGIDAMLLEETAEAGPLDAAVFDLYQPILNVAGHYRWDLGLSNPAGPVDAGFAGLSFAIEADPSISGRDIQRVPDMFWSNGELPAASTQQYYACIPATANPEKVLQRLAELR